MSASQRSACFSAAPSLLDVFVLDVLCKQGTRRDRRLPGHDSPPAVLGMGTRNGSWHRVGVPPTATSHC